MAKKSKDPQNIEEVNRAINNETKFNFVVDPFEELILQDLGIHNKELLRKLKRNLTKKFKEWIITKVEQKEPVGINLRGGVRTGKSLGGLRVCQIIVNQYENKIFDINKIVCGNQGEYMSKLQDVEFGDVLQMDEKLFGEVGEGSNAMESQLTNTANITAKYNIHNIAITPKRFVNNNASLGLVTWGRDSKNWVSRYIIYDLRGIVPVLLGFVVINIKPLYEDFGCNIFKKCGGCPNPKQYKPDLKTLKKEFHRPIKKEEESKLIYDGKSCPFYNICELPMCKYEVKKDSWIEGELKGGLGSRQKEVLKTALRLMQYVCLKDGDNIKFKTTNKKETKELAKIFTAKVTNFKYTITEFDSVLTNLFMAVTNIEVLNLLCEQAELKPEDIINSIPNEE